MSFLPFFAYELLARMTTFFLGSVMVDSLNCSYDYGELSNSQKEALITLIEKKIKTRGTCQTGDRFLSLMLTLK